MQPLVSHGITTTGAIPRRGLSGMRYQLHGFQNPIKAFYIISLFINSKFKPYYKEAGGNVNSTRNLPRQISFGDNISQTHCQTGAIDSDNTFNADKKSKLIISSQIEKEFPSKKWVRHLPD